MKPLNKVETNTWDFFQKAMIAPSGFREYDARWRYPDEINLPGLTALGQALGTQMHRHKLPPTIAVGNDYREYSLCVKNAFMLGLIKAGIQVKDIGLAVSPMAYFSQIYLKTAAVGMITASHNPNGWTGVKVGFEPPLTHGPEEMEELKNITLNAESLARAGGSYEEIGGVADAYIDDICRGFKLTRPLKVVCATGNGTASAFAPKMLQQIGAEVIPLHTTLNYSFPIYNPNPESLEMLHDMSAAVGKTNADLALGFDGDGDRCGVVDNEGREIFADKMALIMARDWAGQHPDSTLVVDVKSTGLFTGDPILLRHGLRTDYWKTGHSHIKRRVKELNALAGFERSGHYYLAGPLGNGYDCGLRVALEICKLLDRNPGKTLAGFYRDLPPSFASPTMSLYCPDTKKYQVVNTLVSKFKHMADAGQTIGRHKIVDMITVNGARVVLDNGSWGLVRASSNLPNLVVVCESNASEQDLRLIFTDFDAVIKSETGPGDYDQKF